MTISTTNSDLATTKKRPRGVPRIAGLGILGLVALALVVAFALLAAFGPLLAPHDPDTVDLTKAYWAPDAQHVLGYDQQGRDLLSRLLYGARTSFLGPLIVVIVATVAGTALAIAGAWRRGWLDATLAGFLDASMSFPGILLAVMVVAIFGAGLGSTVCALAIAFTPYMARIVRSAAVGEVEKDYVDSLRVQGFSALRICTYHVVPNIMPIVLGQAALTLGWATVDLAGLSYLGLGLQPPTADWGVMVASGQTGVLAGYPMEAIASGICLIVAVCSFGVLGERVLRRAEVDAA